MKERAPVQATNNVAACPRAVLAEALPDLGWYSRYATHVNSALGLPSR
jgi:hypothetical protein